MKPIYLDHAAATPLDPAVLQAMLPYLTDNFYNPSALYLASQDVAGEIAAARARIAHRLGCRPVEIIFTAGGTEANNLAISGVMRQYPQARMLASAVEHDSVLAAATPYQHTVVPVRPDGVIDLQVFQAALDDQTVLISCMYANNEVGTIQPVRDLARMVADVRKSRQARGVTLPLYLHTDAAQATNYLDIHVSRLGIDLLTLNGGKIYGPKQSGALYVKAGLTLEPLIRGGGQEQGVRSGTENVAAIAGLAAALDIAQDMRQDETRRLQELQAYCIERITSTMPDAIINGSLSRRLPNNVHITVPGQDNERLIMALDDAGIMAAAGSACSASSEDASHVLLALGLSEDAARSSLRFTMGRSTYQPAIDRLVAALQDIAKIS